MKRTILYNLLFFMALTMGCKKKDLPDPVDGIPIFSADLDFVNGNKKSWEAGVDSFYMFTSFEKDQHDVMVFSGKMERENCSMPCRETLQIIIRDRGLTTAAPTNIDAALDLTNYPFAVDNPVDTIYVINTTFIYQLSLSVDTSIVSPNDFTNYEWFENGNFFSEELNPTMTFDQVPTSEFTLRVTDLSPGDSCMAWQTQQIQMLPEKRCAVRIEPHYNVDSFLESLEAIAYSQAVSYSFNWSDGSTGNILDGQFEPQVPYSVTMSDDQGCQSDAGYIWSGFLGIAPDVGCTAHFNYEILEVPTFADTTQIIVPGDSLQLSAVTIIYVDEMGNTFRSDRFEQNSNTGFSIENVEEYDENENGQPTKKFGIRFNCLLWDENGNELPIINGKAVWGVAYPK